MFRKFAIAALSMFLMQKNDHYIKEEPLRNVFVETGIVCWYGPGLHGKKTASGIIFDMNQLVAAHRKLQFGTFVKVTNKKNNKQVVVEIVDRGPVSKKRVMDLSKKAAIELDFVLQGIATADIEIVGYGLINNRAMLKHFRNIQIIKLGKILI